MVYFGGIVLWLRTFGFSRVGSFRYECSRMRVREDESALFCAVSLERLVKSELCRLKELSFDIDRLLRIRQTKNGGRKIKYARQSGIFLKMRFLKIDIYIAAFGRRIFSERFRD